MHCLMICFCVAMLSIHFCTLNILGLILRCLVNYKLLPKVLKGFALCQPPQYLCLSYTYVVHLHPGYKVLFATKPNDMAFLLCATIN